MTKDATEIEVEVVEIENSAPLPARATTPAAPHEFARHDWRQWRGKVMQLSGWWWPVWLILGIVAFALLATVGMVIGLIVAVFLVCRSLVRALFR